MFLREDGGVWGGDGDGGGGIFRRGGDGGTKLSPNKTKRRKNVSFQRLSCIIAIAALLSLSCDFAPMSSKPTNKPLRFIINDNSNANSKSNSTNNNNLFNSSVESTIATSPSPPTPPPTPPITPQKFCRFIPFDKKDELSHYVSGWEDNAHEERMGERRHRQLSFEAKTRNEGDCRKNCNKDKMHKVMVQLAEPMLNNDGLDFIKGCSAGEEEPKLVTTSPISGRSIDGVKYMFYVCEDDKHIVKNSQYVSAVRRHITRPVQNKDDKQIYFIHVGKTGGSTLACNIRVARIGTRTCNDQRVSALHEPAISKYITKRWHMKTPDTNAKKFVISIRNPIERIKSWYLYEHPLNFRNTVQRLSKGPINKYQSCSQIMLYVCYDTLDDLATSGLNDTRPNMLSFDHPKVDMNITSDQCKIWAWGAVQGHIAATYHNYWNYEKLAGPILLKINQNKNNSNDDDDDYKQIYVIRTEFLWQDFTFIDTIFSDKFDNKQNHETGSSSKLSVPKHNMQKLNSANDFKLNVTNKNISYDGLKNLCKALCDEIQIYKQLLLKAVNLNDDDRETSMVKLRESCPDESSIEIRECVY